MIRVEELKLKVLAAKAYETSLTEGHYISAARIAKEFEPPVFTIETANCIHRKR